MSLNQAWGNLIAHINVSIPTKIHPIFIPIHYNQHFFFFFLFFETEGWQASAKAQETVDHLTSNMSSREEISELETEPPTSSLRFGYLLTFIE